MGITMNAGPGKTRSAIPISNTVTPITETIIRRTILIFSRFQKLKIRLIQHANRLALSLRERLVKTSSLIIKLERSSGGNARLRKDQLRSTERKGSLFPAD